MFAAADTDKLASRSRITNRRLDLCNSGGRDDRTVPSRIHLRVNVIEFNPVTRSPNRYIRWTGCTPEQGNPGGHGHEGDCGGHEAVLSMSARPFAPLDKTKRPSACTRWYVEL